jgi:hypothetical protein
MPSGRLQPCARWESIAKSMGPRIHRTSPAHRSALSVKPIKAFVRTLILRPGPRSSDVIVVSGACPIKYFVWGDDIVLVDSCTREVVEIIVGVA